MAKRKKDRSRGGSAHNRAIEKTEIHESDTVKSSTASKVSTAIRRIPQTKGASREFHNSSSQFINNSIDKIGPFGFTLITIAIGCLTADKFSWGISFLYLGLVALAIHLAYKLHEKHGWMFITATLLAYFLIICACSKLFLFVPAPLTVQATSSLHAWGPGSNMYGIEWKEQYSELEFSIFNPSETTYKNFDAEIATDIVIAALKQKPNEPASCMIYTENPAQEAHAQRYHGKQPVGPADDPSLPHYFLEMKLPDGSFLPPEGASKKFRIRCDEIPAKIPLDFYAATEVFDSHHSSKGPLFLPPKPSASLNAVIQYEASFGRKRKLTISHCSLKSPCVFKE